VVTNTPSALAESPGIALVCREEIEGLLSQIEGSPAPDRLDEDALSAIPRSKQQPTTEG
jgi:hypothetical protein